MTWDQCDHRTLGTFQCAAGRGCAEEAVVRALWSGGFKLFFSRHGGAMAWADGHPCSGQRQKHGASDG